MCIISQAKSAVKARITLRQTAGLIRRASTVWTCSPFGIVRIAKTMARTILRRGRCIGYKHATITWDNGGLILEEYTF